MSAGSKDGRGARARGIEAVASRRTAVLVWAHKTPNYGNFYYILGLYRDNGKENGNYRDYRDYIGLPSDVKRRCREERIACKFGLQHIHTLIRIGSGGCSVAFL